MKCLFFSCAVFVIVALGLPGVAAPAIAPKPLYRDPVYDGAADPTVIWDRAGHRWVMFYTNRRANAENLPGVSWVHGTRIGIAESTDGGGTLADSAICRSKNPAISGLAIYHAYAHLARGIFSGFGPSALVSRWCIDSPKPRFAIPFVDGSSPYIYRADPFVMEAN
jgi:hypothetical protein